MPESLSALLQSAAAATTLPPSDLDVVKTWTEIVTGVVTALALIVGGIWAYYKFIKGRIYRPRLEITIDPEWRTLEEGRVLEVTVAVKNIGSSFVRLLHKGTGLETYPMSTPQPPPPRLSTSWDDGPVLPLLTDHMWIEPGETISDDLMLRNVESSHPLRLDVRLLCRRRRPFRNIEVTARRIAWPPATGAAHREKEKENARRRIRGCPGLRGRGRNGSARTAEDR